MHSWWFFHDFIQNNMHGTTSTKARKTKADYKSTSQNGMYHNNVFVGIYFIGAGIAGTNVEMAYCRGLPFEMDPLIQKARGTSQWNKEVGEYFQLTTIIFAEVFMGLEMVSILYVLNHIVLG